MPDDLSEKALAVMEMARAGRFDAIREMFAPQLQALVATEALRAAWTSEVDRRGEVSSVGTPIVEPAGPGVSLVRIPLAFDGEGMTVVLSFDGRGALTGLQLAPASAATPTEPWVAPPYVDTNAFEEREVTLGSGPLAAQGTLALPRGQDQCPAAVLLAGSGPSDRDETIGRNKPLKDLASGLATLGIASLRFDKVTYAHRDQLASLPSFTVNDEYVRDAAAAIRLLAQDPAVDASRIFVLGHSLGGTVAPRIATVQPEVAGLVILAGGAQPQQWAIVRQVVYLASLQPENSSAAEPSIAALTRQAHMVDSPDLSPTTPSAELPFGVPAPYWLDLRAYDPVAAAAALGKPMLILQGGRDYQVTVDDDLAVWRAGLEDRANVTIRVYENDNHLFFVGSGRSTPAEYEPAQHVDPEVVAEIANWVTSQR